MMLILKKAHDATITKLSWAHPEFGYVLASSSFDRVVKIWEQTAPEPDAATAPGAPGSAQRWVERTSLVDARGSVRAVEFAPHHFGLKLVSLPYTCISS
jgi:nucleoporin SEH1